MSSGIRATVQFTSSDTCPIVDVSATAETTIDSVSVNVCPSGCSESVIEFSADDEYTPSGDVTPVFSHGGTTRYRLTRIDSTLCPCECLGQFGCPVARYVARDGTLTLVFYAGDYDKLQDIIAELRRRFPDMAITRLVRSTAGEQSCDNAFVDRSKLTARQLEVLELAYEMDYFERPRQSNATEIATELGISPATFREHLTAAQSKIFEDIL
jgi:predicted DNA binding protein